MKQDHVHRAWWQIGTGVLVWCLFLGAHAEPADWQPATVAMHAQQLSAHCWYVHGHSEEATRENQGFMSNAGIVITPAGVVVFDALGTPALGDRLLAQIRGLTRRPVVRVILSHYHADHFYGAKAFQRLGVPVEAYISGRGYLASDVATKRLAERRLLLGPWLGPDFSLPVADRWLEGDESFSLGGISFSIQHVGPSHSPDDLVMTVHPDGVAFTGDVYYQGRVPFVGDAPIASWLQALDQLVSLNAAVYVPGHGPATRDPGRGIAQTRDYLSYLRDQMRAAVEQFETFDAAYARIDWSRFADWPAFQAANRANAYNVYLQMESAALKP